jgi:hypothetical protein
VCPGVASVTKTCSADPIVWNVAAATSLPDELQAAAPAMTRIVANTALVLRHRNPRARNPDNVIPWPPGRLDPEIRAAR